MHLCEDLRIRHGQVPPSARRPRRSPGARRTTLGADKAYDAAAFVTDIALNVTPHIAQNISGRRSALDARTTHAGYAVSQQKRKRVEEPFGWGKTIGGLARPILRGVKKLGFKFTSQWPATISSAYQSSSRP